MLAGLIILIIAAAHFFTWNMSSSYETFLSKSDQGLFQIKYLPFKGDSFLYLHGGNMSSNTAVIGVHGSPGSADNLDLYYQDSMLMERVQLVSYDRMGFGKASGHAEFDRLADEATYLHQLVTRNNADTVIFLGHSYGSSVVLRYLTMFDDRIYRAVLIGSPIDPDLEKGLWWRRFLNAKLIRWLIPTSLRRCNAEIVSLKDELTAQENMIGSIDFPIIFYQGEDDKIVPAENLNYFRERDSFPAQHKYIIIPDDGHFILWSKYEEVVELLLSL
mgnify:CR=1 FL=1